MLALYEKVGTGCILGTFGFIVSRVPLTGAKSELELVNMGYQKRQQLVMTGRVFKLMAYSALVFAFYTRNQHVNQRMSNEQFEACVAAPIKTDC